jgi:serine protease Do
MALAMFSAACGDDGGNDVDASGGSTTTAPPTDDTSPSAPTVNSISDVEQSVVQIISQGTFVSLEGVARNAGITGTGFIISEDGLVVTNNHVVTGAATLAVSFSGSDDTINARLLGVSECSDLAVIQLTGDGYTPLSFRDDEVSVGIEVFSAGYPASDDPGNIDLDFTLTNGIVGSTRADGESNWASVDGVIQHDARILGGNSGGPLVDENGHVIGINYAGSDQFDTNFAISAAEARPIIDRLAAGEDVDSLGINGEATVFDSGLTGVWIRSVESGSPADNAGIEPGDLMITLENLVLATDGTMADYCDVLRTKGSDATMDFEVYRPSLDIVLEGQVNGQAIVIPLITQTVIEGGGDAGTNGGSGNTGTGENGAPAQAYDYTTVTDDQGLISVSIPTAWGEVDGSPNPDFGASIWASPDIQGWQESWAVPGIIVESAADRSSADIPGLLAERDLTGVCEDLGADDYDDGLYAGTLQVWGNCGGTGTYYVILAASPLDPAQDYLVRVEVQAVDSRDLEAADEALATFVANI